jgi:hypothetical protein
MNSIFLWRGVGIEVSSESDLESILRPLERLSRVIYHQLKFIPKWVGFSGEDER